MSVHRRVGVFQAIETYILHNGEWFREPRRSTKAISDLINDWTTRQQVEVTFISEPKIDTVAANEQERTYRTAVSIIYIPVELIDDGRRNNNVEVSREIQVPQTPEEIIRLLAQAQDNPATSVQKVAATLSSVAAGIAPGSKNVRKP